VQEVKQFGAVNNKPTAAQWFFVVRALAFFTAKEPLSQVSVSKNTKRESVLKNN
jgi:hypothetical protein